MLKAYWASQKKGSHAVNEDSFIIDERLFMVADGVGSSPYPQLASEATVQMFSLYFYGRDEAPDAEDIRRFVEAADIAVREYSYGSSSTITAVWFQASKEAVQSFTAVSIGDSRLYLMDFSEGAPDLRRLSTDHVVVQERRVWRGFFKGSDWPGAWIKQRREFLTFVVGGFVRHEPLPHDAIFSGTLSPGQWLILCTDGCWRYLEANREALLSRISGFRVAPEEMLTAMVSAAAYSCRDDATIILIKNEP